MSVRTENGFKCAGVSALGMVKIQFYIVFDKEKILFLLNFEILKIQVITLRARI